jgi:hypothetical protein
VAIQLHGIGGYKAKKSMKKNVISILLAFLLYIVGVMKIIHWNAFWSNNEELRKRDYFRFIDKYREEIASYIPQYKQFPHMLEVLSIVLFCISGFISFSQKSTVLKVFGITAFLLAFWNLFSLM